MTTLVLCCCLATQAAPAVGAPVPSRIVVLAETPDYQALASAEGRYLGIIDRVPGSKMPPTYRLLITQVGQVPVPRSLSTSGKAHLIEPLVGKTVTVVGKVAGDGKIWPGRIEPLLAKHSAGNGILASTYWSSAGPIFRGRVRTQIIRDSATLARMMRIRGDTAGDTASALMARRMGVPAIDWKKHVVVAVTSGAGSGADHAVVTRATVRDAQQYIYYRLPRNKERGMAVNFPTHVVLVPRSERVQLMEEPEEGTIRRIPNPRP